MPTTKQPPIEGPATRFGAVRGFLIDRGARNYLSVFAALGERFTDKEADRIAALWNARARIDDYDMPLLVRMERAIERLRNAA
jgi:hypothetical protein